MCSANRVAKFLAWLVVLSFTVDAYAGGPTSEGIEAHSDDALIARKVKAALIDDRYVPATRIEVQTNAGVVRLSGLADSELQRSRAGETAAAVDGVRRVENDIALETR